MVLYALVMEVCTVIFCVFFEELEGGDNKMRTVNEHILNEQHFSFVKLNNTCTAGQNEEEHGRC